MNVTRGELLRACDQIPNQFVDVPVTTSPDTIDLNALPYLPAKVVYRFTGVDTTAIPGGTAVVIGGVDFETDDDAVIDGTTADVAMTAVDKGFLSTLAAAQAGALDAPISDILDAGSVVSVTTKGATLGAGGKRVHLIAIGGAVTVLRGDHTADPLAAAAGLIVGTASNPLQSFYVSEDATADNTLTHVAAGSVTLRVMFSDDV